MRDEESAHKYIESVADDDTNYGDYIRKFIREYVEYNFISIGEYNENNKPQTVSSVFKMRENK